MTTSLESQSKITPPSDRPIYLVSYPKIVLLYPTFMVSVLATFLSMWFGGDNVGMQSVIGATFLVVFGLNLVVLAFDFPRTTSLTLFFFIAALIMGLVLLFRSYPDILPALSAFLRSIEPVANSTFYGLFTFMLTLIYLVVLAMVRMDYWEVRPNELLHHHGFLSNLERFSAPNLRISKEISDVFEYMLLRSGRLILHPSNEPRAFVLDNVLFIDKKEKDITRMLGSLQVSVRNEPTES